MYVWFVNLKLTTLFVCKSNKKANQSGKNYVFLQTVNFISRWKNYFFSMHTRSYTVLTMHL